MNARRKRIVAGLGAFAAVSAVVGTLVIVPALATPPSGATTELLGGPAPVGASHARAEATPDWWAKIETKGESDLVGVRVTVAPGGTLGWHTHPGLELAIIVSGTATYYYGDDPTCTPHAVTAGHGVVPLDGGRVHTLRNEGSVPLVLVSELIVRHGAAPRIDRPSPGNCPF